MSSSSSVEERIVSLVFQDNFSKAAEKATSILDKLSEAISNIGKNTDEDSLTNVLKKLNLDSLGTSFEESVEQVSAWKIAVGNALGDVLSDIIDFAEKVADTLVVDPIKSGLSEYEELVQSMQTTYMNTGASMDDVVELLDELNTYSDQTIYKFSDMTTAVARFSTQGVTDLEDIKKGIEGIGNAAAYAGLTTSQASSAYEASAKILSMGYMNLRQYYSLSSQGILNNTMRDALLEAAVELGTITEVGENTYKTLSAASGSVLEFTGDASGFYDTVGKAHWVTSEVWLKALEKYTDTTDEVGKQAWEAATTIKTFTQMLDVLGEMLQTGWSESFRILIGDYEDARKVWTTIGDELTDLIDEMSAKRNTFLKELLQINLVSFFGDESEIGEAAYNIWMEFAHQLTKASDDGTVMGGTIFGEGLTVREAIMQTLIAAYKNLKEVIDQIGEAWNAVFPAITTKDVAAKIFELFDFIYNTKADSQQLQTFFEIFKSVMTIFKDVYGIAMEIGKGAYGIFTEIFPNFPPSVNDILTSVQNFFNSIHEFLAENTSLKKLMGILVENARELAIFIKEIATDVVGLLSSKMSGMSFSELFDTAVNFIGEWLPKGLEFIKKIYSYIRTGVWEFSNLNIKQIIENVKDGVVFIATMIRDSIISLLDNFFGAGSGSTGFIAKINGFFSDIRDSFTKLGDEGNIWYDRINSIKNAFSQVHDVFLEPVVKKIKEIQNADLDSNSFFSLLLKGSLIVTIKKAISEFDAFNTAAITEGTTNANTFLDNLGNALGQFVETTKLTTFSTVARNVGITMVLMASAVGILALAVKTLADLPVAEAIQSCVMILVMLTAVVAICSTLFKTSFKFGKNGEMGTGNTNGLLGYVSVDASEFTTIVGVWGLIGLMAMVLIAIKALAKTPLSDAANALVVLSSFFAVLITLGKKAIGQISVMPTANKTIKEYRKMISTFTVLILAMSVMALAIGHLAKVGTTDTIIAAGGVTVALLAVCAAIASYLHTSEFTKSFKGGFKNNLQFIVVVSAVIAVINALASFVKAISKIKMDEGTLNNSILMIMISLGSILLLVYFLFNIAKSGNILQSVVSTDRLNILGIATKININKSTSVIGDLVKLILCVIPIMTALRTYAKVMMSLQSVGIDWGGAAKLTIAMGVAMVGIVWGLAVVLGILSDKDVKRGLKKVKYKTVIQMALLCAGLAILVKTMAEVAVLIDDNWLTIGVTFGLLVVALGGLYLVVRALGKLQNATVNVNVSDLAKSTNAIVIVIAALAGLIAVMAYSVSKVTNVGSLIVMFVGFIAVIASAGAYFKLLNSCDISTSKIAGLLSIIAALTAAAVLMVTSLKTSGIASAMSVSTTNILAMAGLVVAIGVVTAALSKIHFGTNLWQAATIIIALGAVISAVILSIGGMKQLMCKAKATIAETASVEANFTGSMLATAADIAAIAMVVVAVGVLVRLVASMPSLSNTNKKMMFFGLMMIEIASAVGIMSTALKEVRNVTWDNVIIMVTELAALLTTLFIASKMAGTGSSNLLKVTTIIVAIAGAVALLAEGLSKLKATGIASWLVADDAGNKWGKAIANIVSGLLLGIAYSIEESVPDIVESLVNTILEVVDALGDYAPQLIEAAWNFMLIIVDGIAILLINGLNSLGIISDRKANELINTLYVYRDEALEVTEEMQRIWDLQDEIANKKADIAQRKQTIAQSGGRLSSSEYEAVWNSVAQLESELAVLEHEYEVLTSTEQTVQEIAEDTAEVEDNVSSITDASSLLKKLGIEIDTDEIASFAKKWLGLDGTTIDLYYNLNDASSDLTSEYDSRIAWMKANGWYSAYASGDASRRKLAEDAYAKYLLYGNPTVTNNTYVTVGATANKSVFKQAAASVENAVYDGTVAGFAAGYGR